MLCWAVVFDCCLQAVVLLGFCIHYENQPIGYVLVYRLTASQSFYVIKAIYRVLYIIGSYLVFGVTFVGCSLFLLVDTSAFFGIIGRRKAM